MRTGHKQGELQLPCFSEIGTAREAEQLFLLSCLCSEKQNTGFSCYNATPLPHSLCSILNAAVYKRTPEGGRGAFCFGEFWLDFFASLSTGFKKAKERMLKKSCKPGGKRL
jgi:hypothetical protein